MLIAKVNFPMHCNCVSFGLPLLGCRVVLYLSEWTQYLNSKLLRRAIEREIEIIGEAINRALKQDPDR